MFLESVHGEILLLGFLPIFIFRKTVKILALYKQQLKNILLNKSYFL
tara:strand:+ start:902 stop:1042 length:141 start_codon:yes stop_codon:yes gene_type:complete